MFLPKAFSNGGLLFSSIIMLVVSIASAIAFHLLLLCKNRHGGGYGEIGGIIGGPKLRALILGSITLSQLGFVCAGIVFVAQNLTSFLSMYFF
jgi:solute carrier family 36 (proton-coupled amino acid transporter)